MAYVHFEKLLLMGDFNYHQEGCALFVCGLLKAFNTWVVIYGLKDIVEKTT
jgi:hypothetical protein